MSGQSERTALETVEAFEAAAFRVAHVARRLLADHPGLPLWRIRPYAITHQDPASTHAELEISARDIDGVSAWAEVLGTTTVVRFFDSSVHARAFEFHRARATVGGIEVTVVGSRSDLTDEEIEDWRTRLAELTVAAGGDGAS